MLKCKNRFRNSLVYVGESVTMIRHLYFSILYVVVWYVGLFCIGQSSKNGFCSINWLRIISSWVSFVYSFGILIIGWVTSTVLILMELPYFSMILFEIISWTFYLNCRQRDFGEHVVFSKLLINSIRFGFSSHNIEVSYAAWFNWWLNNPLSGSLVFNIIFALNYS